jgi:hypothetical protein
MRGSLCKTPEKSGRRPVTPEVAGSSPVSLAINFLILL